MSADGSGEDQAEFFVANLDRKLASVGAKRQPDDLPPVLDLEWDHRVNRRGKPIPCSDGQVHADCWATVSPDEIVARVGAWLKRVKELTGREPLVYTANEWVKGRLPDSQFAKLNAKLWVAQYLKHDKTGKRTLLTVSPSTPPRTRAPVCVQRSRPAAGQLQSERRRREHLQGHARGFQNGDAAAEIIVEAIMPANPIHALGGDFGGGRIPGVRRARRGLRRVAQRTRQRSCQSPSLAGRLDWRGGRAERCIASGEERHSIRP